MIICKDTDSVSFVGGKLYVNNVEIKGVEVSPKCSNRIKAIDVECDDTILHCEVTSKDGIIFLTPDNEWKKAKIDGFIRRGADEITLVNTDEERKEALA